MTVISRRRLLATGMAAATTIFTSRALALAPTEERRLSFYNLHTGESFKGPYWVQGEYLPEPLADIRQILRDFRTGEQHQIDRNLLDLLVAIRAWLRTDATFQVISGYRSPKTNAMLHRETRGVAVHSYHMVGKAIDIRVQGRRLTALRDTALALRTGGVGYYPQSNFVHVDVGPVRHW